MEKVYANSKVPIKSWATDIEDGALNQAYNVANLPFVFKHVVLLSDCHQGYGVPIGCVFGAKDVVIPNAVGVDIGCLDGDTEFLTPVGWKKISKWDNDFVLQYDKHSNTANFIYPARYIKKECNKFYHFKTKYGMDMMLSSDHKMLVSHGYKNIGYKDKDWTVRDFIEHHNSLSKGIQGGIKTTFNFQSNTKLNLTDSEIRLIAMISADGCVRKRKTVENSVELHFKKKRKILRAQNILSDCKIDYNFTIGKDNSVFIYFKTRHTEKDLSFMWKASESQLNILADEVLFWDGHRGQHESYYTTNENNADIIQFAFAVSGIRSNKYSPKNKNETWSKNFNVYKTKNNIVGFSKNCISEVESIDGKQYCFSVPSGYFVARRNGYIFITGNCGMCAIKTSMADIDEKSIKKIMSSIRSFIPVGFNKHAKKQPEKWMPKIGIENLDIVSNHYENARKQIGTLGGGNHFIEIQKGDDGFIWFMVHSGSRNIGNQVAKHYNNVAVSLNKMWLSSVPKEWELAFLPKESKYYQMYLDEMNYCVEYAFLNRKLMMEKIKESIVDVFPNTEFDEIINIAHNYASIENHFGKNLMIHRKGATRARSGELGIIPGSQGTSSYIVRGLGNKGSLESCSHGAGRKMGRKQAQRELNFEEQKKILDDIGVIHGMRNAKDLDEAPDAYKDIYEVMKNQVDLVNIVVELKPLAVIKG